VFLGLFLRKKANKSESTSIHIISKTSGKYKVIKTVGCAQTEHTKKKYSTILKKPTLWPKTLMPKSKRLELLLETSLFSCTVYL